MEAECIAPIATSPLDSARGRGKMRYKHLTRRRERHYITTKCDIDIPIKITLCIPNTISLAVAK